MDKVLLAAGFILLCVLVHVEAISDGMTDDDDIQLLSKVEKALELARRDKVERITVDHVTDESEGDNDAAIGGMQIRELALELRDQLGGETGNDVADKNGADGKKVILKRTLEDALDIMADGIAGKDGNENPKDDPVESLKRNMEDPLELEDRAYLGPWCAGLKRSCKYRRCCRAFVCRRVKTGWWGKYTYGKRCVRVQWRGPLGRNS